MPNGNQRKRQQDEEEEEPTKNDLNAALEQLDRAAARVRQIVYRIRPMLRDNGDAGEDREPQAERRAARGQFRGRRG